MASIYTASVIVRNLQINSSHAQLREMLNFGEFSIRDLRFGELQDARKLFDTEDVALNDYVLEKNYTTLPPIPYPSMAGIGGIPEDIEDLLFLLRLFRTGDLAFVKLAISKPDGSILRQFPCRVINALNSYSSITELRDTESADFQQFANQLRSSPSWKASWFLVSRRFFLYGGSKEFSPHIGEVDRVVDYVTALEAALVPEKGYVGKRLRNRATALLSLNSLQPQTPKLLQELYNIRSSIVHGSVLGKATTDWLQQNRNEIEVTVAKLLAFAAVAVPAADPNRTTYLKSLCDVDDDDRKQFVLQQFAEIKIKSVRKDCSDEISKNV